MGGRHGRGVREKRRERRMDGWMDLRAAEDVEAENKGSVLGGFGVWPG